MKARVLVLMLLTACGTEAESKPSQLGDKLEAVIQRMHARFAAVQQIEQGIVTNRLGDVQTAAQSIAELEDPEIQPAWQPYLTSVRDAAKDVAAAEDIGEAAQRAARLGYQCSRCHDAIGGRVAFRGVPRPDTGQKLQATMASHQWAVSRMWEGVIGPSQERWLAGAKALQKAPMTYVAESGALGIENDVGTVRTLSRRAETVKTPLARAELFGQLLGTCVRCHAAIRDTGTISAPAP